MEPVSQIWITFSFLTIRQKPSFGRKTVNYVNRRSRPRRRRLLVFQSEFSSCSGLGQTEALSTGPWHPALVAGDAAAGAWLVEDEVAAGWAAERRCRMICTAARSEADRAREEWVAAQSRFCCVYFFNSKICVMKFSVLQIIQFAKFASDNVCLLFLSGALPCNN
jgi:hypothetical protein